MEWTCLSYFVVCIDLSIDRAQKMPEPKNNNHRHQPDICGLTKSMLQSVYILLLKTIPFLVQQNVGLVGAVYKMRA